MEMVLFEELRLPRPSADASSTWRRPSSRRPPTPHPGLPRSSAALQLWLRQVSPALGESLERPQIAPRASTDPSTAGSLGNPQPAPAAPLVSAQGPAQRGSPAFPADANSRHRERHDCACAAEASAAPPPPGTGAPSVGHPRDSGSY
ncbi:uncharacterized protein Lyrm9l1 [Rattus norvegicus]|uniref:uncharacterized protein Lyrm9l1 n=1 Tax=Rattus norvegicus TaxID=10116 RepID=UPI001916F25E|nr:predicted GPI-anchored protein 58 [Rattus norvegicus]